MESQDSRRSRGQVENAVSDLELRFFPVLGLPMPVWEMDSLDGSVLTSLELPSDLIVRLREWTAEFNGRELGEAEPWTEETLLEFDRRGFRLSRDVERESRVPISVRYGALTSAIRAMTG